MRTRHTRSRHWLPLALCALLGAQAHAAGAPASEASLTDANRYLLLYSATGDEHFLVGLDAAGKRLEASLAQRQDADALRALWAGYQQGRQKLLADHAARKLDANAEMAQSLKLAEPLDAYLKAHPQATPDLADDLRQRALLTARQANLRKVDGTRADAEASDIKALDARIQQRIDALAKTDPALSESLAKRWRYLQISQSNGKLLLYPFNAQIEAMLGQLGGA
ncbi:hypothetical protein [Pseudomonas citronellolis]|uniref:hypothetical protein n=1 Tax=Pseudomonas citronellolis TaxID=53408 RepID=UPI0023E385E2|nr:hypothetical protein [Pseudomonas citronellolis]MDF3935546.1 hypothetical protein [Pseudomonas citronellolis]